MTATVNASYVDRASFAAGRSASVFFRIMIALAVLDIVLLFWILNPLSKPSANLPVVSASGPAAVEARGAPKPSPLGAVVNTRMPLRAAR